MFSELKLYSHWPQWEFLLLLYITNIHLLEINTSTFQWVSIIQTLWSIHHKYVRYHHDCWSSFLEFANTSADCLHPPFLSSTVAVRHECKRPSQSADKEYRLVKCQGNEKVLYSLQECLSHLAYLEVFRGAFTVDSICFPGSLPLHHCEKLCRDCGKTWEQRWHPEDYETSLWSVCITRYLLKRRTLSAWWIHIWSSNGHDHSIIPGPPGCHSVSHSSPRGVAQPFSLSLQ